MIKERSFEFADNKFDGRVLISTDGYTETIEIYLKIISADPRVTVTYQTDNIRGDIYNIREHSDFNMTTSSWTFVRSGSVLNSEGYAGMAYNFWIMFFHDVPESSGDDYTNFSGQLFLQ